MWWMLGGRSSSREKKKKSEKKKRKKGLKRSRKSSREKIFISIFHIHFRDISIMDIFLMPRTCYMLMLMLFHLIFPFPIPRTSECIEMGLLWIEIWREEEKERVRDKALLLILLDGHRCYIFLFHIFFWCVIREENCNLNLNNAFHSLSNREALCYSAKKKSRVWMYEMRLLYCVNVNVDMKDLCGVQRREGKF